MTELDPDAGDGPRFLPPPLDGRVYDIEIEKGDGVCCGYEGDEEAEATAAALPLVADGELPTKLASIRLCCCCCCAPDPRR